MDELSQKITKWSEIDKEISKINKYLKNIKNTKSSLESDILSLLKKHQLTDKKIRFNNSHFIYNTSNTLPSLSINLLEKVLNESLSEENTQKILERIKLYREENKVESISLKQKNIKPPRRSSLKK